MAPEGDTMNSTDTKTECTRCDGCGRLADSDDREPWSFWESLPWPSNMAVVMGLVKPIQCPDCNGRGEVSA